jgi:hypothetical protein
LNAVESFLTPFLSHDAARGALPTLQAATDIRAAQGSYYAPADFFHLKGDPELIGLPKPARDGSAARRLWDVAEGETGVRFLDAMPVTA